MDKRPEKMTEQEKLLEIQFGVAKKARITDILTIVIFLAIVYIFAASVYIIPDREYSEAERRYLQQKPEFTIERLIDGKFTSEIATYLTDQFPVRDVFVGMKGAMEIALLKKENNSTVAADDGYLIKRTDYPNYEMVDKNTESIVGFAPAMQKLGIPYTVALAGRHADALTRYLPAFYPTEYTDKLWNYFEDKMAEDSYIQFVDLLTPLKAVIDTDGSEQVYYKTDHHWTTYGAYLGYCEIMKSFGVEPIELSAITKEEVSDEFYGTTWASAGMKWIKPDTMYYYRWAGDETDYTTTIVDTGASFTGFYDRSYLLVNDKYSSFIGGNNARADVIKTADSGEKREKLLLIKDSFAHSAVPFLAYHYDIIIIDLRYYKDSVIELITEEEIDRVLILNYMGSMTETNVFGMLNLGLKQFMNK